MISVVYYTGFHFFYHDNVIYYLSTEPSSISTILYKKNIFKFVYTNKHGKQTKKESVTNTVYNELSLGGSL